MPKRIRNNGSSDESYATQPQHNAFLALNRTLDLENGREIYAAVFAAMCTLPHPRTHRGGAKLKLFIESLLAKFGSEQPWDAALIEKGLMPRTLVP